MKQAKIALILYLGLNYTLIWQIQGNLHVPQSNLEFKSNIHGQSGKYYISLLHKSTVYQSYKWVLKTVDFTKNEIIWGLAREQAIKVLY